MSDINNTVAMFSLQASRKGSNSAGPMNKLISKRVYEYLPGMVSFSPSKELFVPKDMISGIRRRKTDSASKAFMKIIHVVSPPVSTRKTDCPQYCSVTAIL